jgi:hypothetical protein
MIGACFKLVSCLVYFSKLEDGVIYSETSFHSHMLTNVIYLNPSQEAPTPIYTFSLKSSSALSCSINKQVTNQYTRTK